MKHNLTQRLWNLTSRFILKLEVGAEVGRRALLALLQ